MIARRRAGLTQQELAERLGVAPGTVGRWERGVVEPRFQVVQEAVGACGLDLVLEFANADNGSWNSMIYEQLRRAPAERVRHLTGGGFDRVEVLKLIGSADVRAIVVGETAGALHGWPLILDGPGGVDLLVPSESKRSVCWPGPRIASGYTSARSCPGRGVMPIWRATVCGWRSMALWCRLGPWLTCCASRIARSADSAAGLRSRSTRRCS